MPRIRTNCPSDVTESSSRDADVPVFLSGMICACAEAPVHPDAPMALALFRRVEILKQPPEVAARALDLKPGDAAYLLAGLRQEVAKDPALVLLAERSARKITDQKESDDELQLAPCDCDAGATYGT